MSGRAQVLCYSRFARTLQCRQELVLVDGAELLSRCGWRGVCFPFFELVEQTLDFGVYRVAIGRRFPQSFSQAFRSSMIGNASPKSPVPNID
jgi:hypothetical protein